MKDKRFAHLLLMRVVAVSAVAAPRDSEQRHGTMAYPALKHDHRDRYRAQ